MATITPYQTKQSTHYRAQVRLKRGGQLVYSESKGAFKHDWQAREWAEAREKQLSTPGGLDRAMEKKNATTVTDLIQLYIDRFGATAGRSKLGHLKQLQGFEIAQERVDRLTSDLIITHITERLETASPSTVNNDLVWLGVVFDAAMPVWKIDVDTREIDLAKKFCRIHKMISKSRKRNRRPTKKELKRLIKYFEQKDKARSVPMAKLVMFAIHSTRRLGEITRLQFSDNNNKKQTGMVRDLKHPRTKEGNHRRFKYTAKAWKIVKSMPGGGDLIFPYNPKTISEYFTRACHMLGIEDLRFHDLRHDGISRLFEGKNRGRYSIPDAQLITLHENWADLKRYANLKPEDL